MRLRKKLAAIVLLVAAFALLLVGCSSGGAEQTTPAQTTIEEEPIVYEGLLFKIDLSQKGKVLGNKVSDINRWTYHDSFLNPPEGTPDSYFSEVMPFVERVQFMQATGGNSQRDLFKNPDDFSVRDDYDFSTLVTACENALKQGIKPMIKTGNVPRKLSKVNDTGVFGVNLYAPDDYDEYYNYIKAMVEALADKFGVAEVKSWRWGVFTEYENKDWFDVGSPEASFEAYCKIYDYTAAAIEDVLGKGIDIGAHSMSVAQGYWDEEDFIRHCASSTNYKTGQKGSPLTYLAVSFYDEGPVIFNTALKSLPDTIEIVRKAAKDAGFENLVYGVDEGRLLSSMTGRDAADLVSRVVGFSYQGAYDARLLRQMVLHDIDYFSAWSYTSAGIWEGVPTVSLHVANEYYKMANSRLLSIEKEGEVYRRSEVEALAAYNEDTGAVQIMAYNLGGGMSYGKPHKLNFVLNPTDKNQNPVSKVRVRTVVVDDDSNFFDEWEADREAAGIEYTDFHWSPDSSVIAGEEKVHKLFWQNYEKYLQCAQLKERYDEVEVINGRLQLTLDCAPDSVVFIEVLPAQ